MALKVTLVKSWAGRPERHRRTLTGLGLYKVNDERVLPDTAAVRGMVRQVTHLVICERVAGPHVPKPRRQHTAQA
ncbi:MAG TPA: 50S ribosomal protein L30 [Myxococcales bacterium]|jgi:large subunit ribosomal protein L30|nr:50S ribosomal protein L30 [Myxococcales bacterium]